MVQDCFVLYFESLFKKNLYYYSKYYSSEAVIFSHLSGNLWISSQRTAPAWGISMNQAKFCYAVQA